MERIAKGKAVIAEAIRNNDHVLLKNCIRTFLDMRAPIEEISEAIKTCPIPLFAQTGFGLEIESSVAGRTLTLGKDVAWEAVAGFIETAGDSDALPLALQAQSLFGGVVMSVEPYEGADLTN